MKKLLIFALPILLLGKMHYAKVEPLERATIKAAASGTITKVDLSAEGKTATDGVVIQIDDAMDKINLKTSQDVYALSEENLKINEEILKGLEESYKLKQSYFERVNGLATSTQTQKDTAYSALVGAKNQWLGTQEKVVNLKKQILDLQYKIKRLEDSISKKSIILTGRYLYKIMVRAGEFAAPGMPLAIADDLSKGKLVIYLDREELKGIAQRKVYLNGSEEGLPISRIWREADEQFISAYRAEIIVPPKYLFSSLLKVEVK